MSSGFWRHVTMLLSNILEEHAASIYRMENRKFTCLIITNPSIYNVIFTVFM
jgi:hypothetical protein